MAHVGTAPQGKVLTATGVTSGAGFKDIGSLSGLTSNGIVIAHGTSAFTASAEGSNGQVLIGATGSSPTFGTITSSGGTIAFTPGANSLNMEAGGAVPTTFTTDSGNAVPAANNLNVLGSHGINTSGAGSTLTVAINNAITLGDLSAIASGSNALSATTGDINIAAGNLKVPDTNAGLTRGVITWTSGPRMHNYGTDNIFFGTSAGNGTLTGTDNIAIGLNGLSALTSGTGNMGVGANCIRNITGGSSNCGMGIATLTTATTSSNNTCVGHNSGNLIATGSGGNTAIGYQSLLSLATGSYNTAIGYQAGSAYVGAESNNISIGNGVLGTAAETGTTRIGASQTACYIDGIDGVNVGSVATVVTESGDKLGTAVITAGTGITVTPGANAITLAVSGSVVGQTITGDSGGALSPTAGNWNIVGLSGSKTSGSGSTMTIKSPPFSQVAASATSSLNTGEFVNGAYTRTLPVSAGLADGDLFIYVCTTASALVIQSVGAQKIRIGSSISSAAGTATSTAIGDSLTLRFNATDGFFYAVSSMGNWI